VITSEVRHTDGTLETLADQVQFLVEEAEERRRLREQLSELATDLNPIATQGLHSITRALAAAELRGYLDMARGGIGVVDRIAGSFDAEDFEALGNNAVLILETVKEMTQPEIMLMLRSTFHHVGATEPPTTTPSLFALWRAFRQPDVRRGLARLIVFLKGLGQSEMKIGKEAR
jgi:uncharacterized protein YjgD (DUF1641 family)